MRFSTRSRYGLRAMIDIARGMDEPVTCEEIAECETVSKKYLDGILGALRRAGLLTSVRGHGGGYRLARPPREISVFDIVRALERSSDIVPCVGAPERCGRSDACTAREVWRRVSHGLDVMLSGMRLADIAYSKQDDLHSGSTGTA